MFLKMGGVGLFFLMMIVFPAVSAQDCTYNGKKYKTGTKLTNICVDMTCSKGQWSTTSTFNSQCALCAIGGDPHIVTFDQYAYDWQAPCNYSLAQPNFGYNEKFGIYGHFQNCQLGSCVNLTTFTDNPNVVITIDHSSLATVSVNGAAYTPTSKVDGLPVGSTGQPVLAWKLGECNMFLGSQGLMLMVCPWQIFVWAYTTLKNNVNGLCGRYSSVQTDDFTDRVNDVHPLQKYPTKFPESWTSAQQSDSECRPGDACPGGNEGRQAKIEECTSLLKDVKWENNSPTALILQQAISDCATDLCNLEASGATLEEINAWKEAMKAMLQNIIMIAVKTKK